MNKYYKYRNKTNKEKIENIADVLNRYWKAISFGVIFLGYATFSIYMNINGFSYVSSDIKPIVGIGLLLLFPIATIFFISKKQTNSTFFETLLMSSMIVYIFNLPNGLNDPFYALLMFMSFGTAVADSLIKNADTIGTNNRFLENFLFFLLLLLILYFTDETTFYLLAFIFIAMTFINNFLAQHSEKKIFNRIVLISFIFFSPLFVAHFIDHHGFKMINFVKRDISIKINNREINSTLIYQTDNELYLYDVNRSFIIKKGDINGDITFQNYKYKSQPILDFNKTRVFVKKYFNKINSN